MGFVAGGWDPVFRSEAPKSRADIVNIGYVLNVIEDRERVETLIAAWTLSQRLLVVSALIRETVPAERAVAFGDGILTHRKTFQDFDQHELQAYIEDAIDQTAVPVAVGIFYVFRDQSDLQTFLVSRTRRT